MSVAAARIEALMQLHPKGYDLSLDRIRGLLAQLDDPQNRLPPTIHVAGTNGKGSTIAFMRALLEAEGQLVHVHTSPHLVHWHERFRIAGKLVEDDVLADAIDRVAAANGGQMITVFEILTATMFVLFAEHRADVALVEVGLGGRFDATNVMEDVAVSVITPIAMDHEAFLGDTLAKIAFEKAGIIRPGTPVVVAPQEDDALAVIERQASRNKAPLSVSGEHFRGMTENGRFLFEDESAVHDAALPRLPGAHQIDNATTAIAAVRALAETMGLTIINETVEQGLRNVVWPGRMQRITTGALWNALPADCELWIDGGHNPAAGTVVAGTLADLANRAPRPVVALCGMLDTKDAGGYLRALAPAIDTMVTLPILSSDAGIPPDALAETARASGIAAKPAADLRSAIAAVPPGSRVLICGSLYLAGDALEANGTFPD